MNIPQIMDSGSSVVVYAGDEVIITWNCSLTFQAWEHVENGNYRLLSAKTVEEVPDSIARAIEVAYNFYLGCG